MAGKPGESRQAQASAGAPAGTVKPAPAKAPAAPYRVGNIEATGLCAALNLYYAEAAKKRGGVADVYDVQFIDPIISNASIVPQGPH